MSDFQLNDDDVVSMNSQYSWGAGGLFKFGWLKQKLKEYLGASVLQWFNDGIECEVLTASSGGWKKGKLFLRLELVLDKPEPEVFDLVLSPNPESESAHE